MYLGNQQQDLKQQYAAQEYSARMAREVGAIAGSEAGGNRTPELPAAIDKMERALDFIECTAKELESRLCGVARPVPPAEPPQAAGQIHPAPPVTGYASTVDSQSIRVNLIAQRLKDLLHRLEV